MTQHKMTQDKMTHDWTGLSIHSLVAYNDNDYHNDNHNDYHYSINSDGMKIIS